MGGFFYEYQKDILSQTLMPDSYMPFNIPLHQLDTPVVKKAAGADGALWSTAAALRDGSRESEPAPPEGVIFQEDFDSMTDWTSSSESTDTVQNAAGGYTLPSGVHSIRQSAEWTPQNGNPDRHAALEVLASNTDKARGGTGKALVQWRESVDGSSNQWKSDGQMAWVFPQTQTLYVEFYMAFSNEWRTRNFPTETWKSKVFRAGSWNGQDTLFSGFGGNVGPLVILDNGSSTFGSRLILSFRGGPWGENYGGTEGDESHNFQEHLNGHGVGGTNPQIVDKVNGGFLNDRLPDDVFHNQVYGPDSTYWTKFAFFFQMNSEPGVADGVFIHWMDDVQILRYTDRMYVDTNTNDILPGWNYFTIGGNHQFEPYPDSERHEEWLAWDDVYASTEIPEGLAHG